MNSPLYLVTVVHNRWKVTERFALLLARQTLQPIVFVLVDDGSTDGTAARVKAAFPSTIVLRGDGNLWWAGGLQKGLNWLSAQGLDPETVVGFLNDDIAFGDDYCEKAVAELRGLSDRSFLVAPGRFTPSGRLSEEAGIADWSRYRYLPYGRHPERIDHATTRTLFMRWKDLKTVGGFHPTLLPHYTSDYEFTIRAKRQGIRLVPARTLEAQFFDETTGDHTTTGLVFAERWKRLFSPRFSYNPLHHFFFIWYAVPWWWKVPCWGRVAWSALKFLK
jgi:GT2 family glycosyltransferase